MRKNLFRFETELPVSCKKAFAWHLREGALERLTPPWAPVRTLFNPACPDQEGGQVGFKVRFAFLSFRWILEHRNFISDQQFSDFQVQGPFKSYEHLHHFVVKDATSSLLVDEIKYSIPCFQKKLERQFLRLFSWRKQILRDDLKMWDHYPQYRLRILVSGASGFIGSQLKLLLQLCGHEVISLVRRKDKVSKHAIFWDPSHENFDKENFERFDAVVHLAGASIANGRWNKKRKEQIFLSRCRDTWLLSQILSRLHQPPKTLITASAIGYYGHRPNEQLTEDSAQGSGFLADLCGKWEAATQAIENRGVRVVHARFGVVLGAKGGILDKMLPIFRLGLGGKLGLGQQVVSWIGIDDLLGAIYHVLMKDSLSGPVNLVAPEPVTHKEFVRILAKKLSRPAFFSIPSWVLRFALGEMADEMILTSQNVKPKKLLASGYEFRYAHLSRALDYVM